MGARPSPVWPVAEDSSEPASAQSETNRFCHWSALGQESEKKTGVRRGAARRRNVSVRRSTALNRSEDGSRRRWPPNILLRRSAKNQRRKPAFVVEQPEGVMSLFVGPPP